MGDARQVGQRAAAADCIALPGSAWVKPGGGLRLRQLLPHAWLCSCHVNMLPTCHSPAAGPRGMCCTRQLAAWSCCCCGSWLLPTCGVSWTSAVACRLRSAQMHCAAHWRPCCWARMSSISARWQRHSSGWIITRPWCWLPAACWQPTPAAAAARVAPHCRWCCLRLFRLDEGETGGRVSCMPSQSRYHALTSRCPAFPQQLPWPFYFIGTRDSFTHHLVPVRCDPRIHSCQWVREWVLSCSACQALRAHAYMPLH